MVLISDTVLSSEMYSYKLKRIKQFVLCSLRFELTSLNEFNFIRRFLCVTPKSLPSHVTWIEAHYTNIEDRLTQSNSWSKWKFGIIEFYQDKSKTTQFLKNVSTIVSFD